MNKRLELLESMIQKGSTDPFVHYARALELRGMGRLDEAYAALAEVARAHPSYVPTYLMAGGLAAKLGRTDEARDFYRRGLEAARAAGDGKALTELSAALEELEPI